MTDDTDDEVVAFHEASHAVAAWERRVPFDTVTIVPTADSLGRICWRGLPVPGVRSSPFWLPEELRSLRSSDVDLIDDHIVVTYAGSIGGWEFLQRTRSVFMGPDDGLGGRDEEIAQRLVNKIDVEYFGGEVPDGASGPVNEPYLRHQRLVMLKQEARRLLADHWAVAAIANLLLQRRTLSGADVHLFMREVIP